MTLQPSRNLPTNPNPLGIQHKFKLMPGTLVRELAKSYTTPSTALSSFMGEVYFSEGGGVKREWLVLPMPLQIIAIQWHQAGGTQN